MASSSSILDYTDVLPISSNTADESCTNESRKIVIAVLGAPGSGKSSFINLVSGANLPVSDNYSAGTHKVKMAPNFELDGFTVSLIDTPGFGSLVDSGTNISLLKGMNDIFAEEGVHIDEHTRITLPVIYLHRTFDIMPTFLDRLIRLCESVGPKRGSLEHVAFVANVWDGEVDSDMEREVAKVREFFKPALDKGAQFLCHNNTVSSAQVILRNVVRCWPCGGDGYVHGKPRRCEGYGLWVYILMGFLVVLWTLYYTIYFP